MRLTAYTDFSLRVLIYLAIHPERRPTIAEIAERYGASKAHMMKVVYQLGLKGYVATMRGKGGGLALARPQPVVARALRLLGVDQRIEVRDGLSAGADPDR